MPCFSKQQRRSAITFDVIVAQCTPHGAGALALLRLSGQGAIALASVMARLSSGKELSEQNTHTIHHGYVIDKNGAVIDTVLFLLMCAPRTFTGDDTIEISCHNNALVIERIIQRALQLGARVADRGEFCKRAVLNGKIDVLQAEAINEVINAPHEQSLKKALAQLSGSFSQWVTSLEDKLLRAIMLCEASFEFLDDENIRFDREIADLLAEICTMLNSIKRRGLIEQHKRDGVRIVLLGAVNSGKSSLFNALLEKNRAIVSPLEGTTRDSIEAYLHGQKFPSTLIDTAGIRETDDRIEQEGIERSLAEAHNADIILLVIDSVRPISPQEMQFYRTILDSHKQKTILIFNKKDLIKGGEDNKNHNHTPLLDEENSLPFIIVSAKNGDGIESLKNIVDARLGDLFCKADAPFLINERQQRLLYRFDQDLRAIQESLRESIAYEILSHQLRSALSCITELTGKSIAEQGMDAIFRSFCVGK